MNRTQKLLSLSLVPFLAFAAGCGGQAAGSDEETVRIGVVGASDPYWTTYADAAEDAGIDVEIVDFAEYTQPNPALTEGELDLNQFQHLVYLARYNVSSGEDLVPVGSTAIYPLGLYSTQYESVADIPDGATVAVPNDESNLARGLLVLQSAGLLSLKDGGGPFATLDDIDESGSRVKVTTLEASLTPTSLPDVAAAIINNDFVEDAGLKAADAIAQDDPSDPRAIPYVNVFAARAGEQDNETYRRLVEIYQDTPAVHDGVQKASGNTARLLKVPAEDLVASLKDVEADVRALG